MAIQIKDLDQLKVMRRAGLLVGQTLQVMRENIKAGIIEMKSVENGKTKAKPLKDLLDGL